MSSQAAAQSSSSNKRRRAEIQSSQRNSVSNNAQSIHSQRSVVPTQSSVNPMQTSHHPSVPLQPEPTDATLPQSIFHSSIHAQERQLMHRLCEQSCSVQELLFNEDQLQRQANLTNKIQFTISSTVVKTRRDPREDNENQAPRSFQSNQQHSNSNSRSSHHSQSDASSASSDCYFKLILTGSVSLPRVDDQLGLQLATIARETPRTLTNFMSRMCVLIDPSTIGSKQSHLCLFDWNKINSPALTDGVELKYAMSPVQVKLVETSGIKLRILLWPDYAPARFTPLKPMSSILGTKSETIQTHLKSLLRHILQHKMHTVKDKRDASAPDPKPHANKPDGDAAQSASSGDLEYDVVVLPRGELADCFGSEAIRVDSLPEALQEWLEPTQPLCFEHTVIRPKHSDSAPPSDLAPIDDSLLDVSKPSANMQLYEMTLPLLLQADLVRIATLVSSAAAQQPAGQRNSAGGPTAMSLLASDPQQADKTSLLTLHETHACHRRMAALQCFADSPQDFLAQCIAQQTRESIHATSQSQFNQSHNNNLNAHLAQKEAKLAAQRIRCKEIELHRLSSAYKHQWMHDAVDRYHQQQQQQQQQQMQDESENRSQQQQEVEQQSSGRQAK